ncbi:hypothetical protein [Devosia sp. DBB001]|nr:hypothetical protein [Devosia sp. DBB001]
MGNRPAKISRYESLCLDAGCLRRPHQILRKYCEAKACPATLCRDCESAASV